MKHCVNSRRFVKAFVFVVALVMVGVLLPFRQVSAETGQTVLLNEIAFDNSEIGDAVELYNAGTEDVDLSGYYLTDDNPEKHKFTIADGTKIGPGEYLVYKENKDNITGFDFGLGASADKVSFYNAAGELVDEFAWTAATESGTYSRLPDGGPWSTVEDKIEVTFGKPNARVPEISVPAAAVINEVDSQPADWVELYNPGTEAMDVSGFEIRDNADDHRFVLAEGTVIPAQGFLVIQEETAGKAWDDKTNTYVDGTFGGSMGLGSGDAVRLFNQALEKIDEVSWKEHAAIGDDKALATWSRSPDGSKTELVLSYDTKGASNRPYYPVAINEVESNGDVKDWVEIINLSDEDIDISGWYLLDNEPVGHKQDVVPLQEGTLLKARGFFVFVEDTHFNFGLGKADLASIRDRHGALVAEYEWSAHAAVTYGRNPDGTGDFVDLPESTRGTPNVAESQDPPPEDPRPEALPWPGAQDVTVLDTTPLFLEDSSGLDYDDGSIWAVDNGTGTFWKLTILEDGSLAFADGWAEGKIVQFKKDAGNVNAPGPDAEGITAAGNGLLYIASERDNANKDVNFNVILEVDPNAEGRYVTAAREWDITALLPQVSANTGIEAVEYIANGDLEGKLFDDSTKAVYAASHYPNQHGAGLFFVAVEDDGCVYAINLNKDGSASVVATVDSLIGGAMGLDFDRETGLLWVESDNGFDGRLATVELNGTSTPTIVHYLPPSGMDKTLNNEGFAITPSRHAVQGKRPVYWLADGVTSQALRLGFLEANEPAEPGDDPVILSDGATEITVTGSRSNLPEGVTLVVKPLAKTYEGYTSKSYDIYLMKGGEPFELTAPVRVDIPYNAPLTQQGMLVFYDDGTQLIPVEGVKVSADRVSFVAEHFSTYVLANKKSASSFPETGEGILPYVMGPALLAIALVVLAAAFLLHRRRADER